jgi:hypothetical protein
VIRITPAGALVVRRGRFRRTVRRKAVVERSSRHSYYVLGVEGFDGSGEPVSSRSSWPEVPTTFTSWQISLGLGAGDGRGCCLLVCHER